MIDNGDASEDVPRVGYKQPPVHTRFERGASGNPSGRPKKPRTVGQIVAKALRRRVAVKTNGRSRTVSVEEGLIQTVLASALRGDLKAVQLAFALKDRYADSSETAIDAAELAQDDATILRAFQARLRVHPGEDELAGSGEGAESEPRGGSENPSEGDP